MHGKAPLAIPTSFKNTKFPSVAEKIKNVVTSWEEALAAHELARSQMAEQIKLNFTPFKKGQIVWLDTRHLKTNYHRKMAPKWEGPFKIEEVPGLATYQLKLPESWKIHKVFHTTLMSIQRKWSLWRELSTTITRCQKWRRSLWSWTGLETPKKGVRLQIPCQMGWISNHQGLVGTEI